MSSTAEETVDRLLNKLFVNGAGQTADRLVLIQEDHPGRAKITNALDLGGYSRLPVRDILLDALRAHEQAVRAEGWQPIKTAPKGRKLIVGYLNPLGNWRSVMGCYYLDGTLESDTDDSGFAPEGWYEETEAYEYLMPMDQEPTRWQPLPAPPSRRDDIAAERSDDAE